MPNTSLSTTHDEIISIKSTFWQSYKTFNLVLYLRALKWNSGWHETQHNNTQYNDIQHNDKQHNNIQHNNK
jgi:hypothetical protein